jgi:sulfur carrier protein
MRNPSVMTNPTHADAAQTVELQLDGRAHRVPAGTTLADLVAQTGHEAARVATSVNGHFVPRAERAGRVLQAGDKVLFFQAIVGG